MGIWPKSLTSYKFLEVDVSVCFRFQCLKVLLRELDIFSFGVFKAPDQAVALDRFTADGAPEAIPHPAAALVVEQVKADCLILMAGYNLTGIATSPKLKTPELMGMDKV